VEHSESIVVNRSLEDVWTLTGDPHAWATWGEIRDVHVMGGAIAEGSAITYRWRGREIEATISPFIDRERMGIQNTQRSYEFHEWIALRDLGDRTEVTFTMGFEPTAWWASMLAPLLSPFKALVLGRPLKKELRSLRDAAERSD
jgi:hypothetical protein